MSKTKVFAPLSIKFKAIDFPIPLEPPVITATLFINLNFSIYNETPLFQGIKSF